MENSSLLISNPKTYSHWWTFIPALPPDRTGLEYKMLRRQWADHTMNPLKHQNGAWKPNSTRGFYIEHREDHISTVLFHLWALFPCNEWVGRLLDLWNVPHGNVFDTRWCYSWEERDDRGKHITDIVLCYADEEGQGILVIETKRLGGKLTGKDLDGGVHYLNMPSLRSFKRRQCAFLVDQRDVARAKAQLPRGTNVNSWQAMGRLQSECILQLPFPEPVCKMVKSYIARHYADLGMAFDPVTAAALEVSQFTGTMDRYTRVRELQLQSSIERFLLGSEVTFCSRQGRMPEPPSIWLATEPSLLDIWQRFSEGRPLQSMQDHKQALWRLPTNR
jgi:hypothetical protein